MNWARIVGIVVQILVLGSALYFAIVALVDTDGGARIFRYQAF